MDILTDVLGMTARYTPWKKEKKLPFYLSAGYEFQRAEIDGCFCILISPKEDLPTIPALKKQIQRIQQEEQLPVVLRVRTMSAFRRKSMIEHKIPFIIEEKQVYLPFMAAYLQRTADAEPVVSEKFMVSTQVLFLMYLYCSHEELYLADAAGKLPYSAMTITRAARQLEESGLFHIRKEGVNKILRSKLPKRELYERAKCFLSSPVQASGFLDKEKVTENMALAGMSALAEKTMMNQDILIDYAIDKHECGFNTLQKELIDPHQQARIEVWKYPPRLFSENGMVDTISLALSFLNEKEERIEQAVEEALEEVWRKVDGSRI